MKKVDELNKLKGCCSLTYLQSIMKHYSALLLIGITKNHHCGLWERSKCCYCFFKKQHNKSIV